MVGQHSSEDVSNVEDSCILGVVALGGGDVAVNARDVFNFAWEKGCRYLVSIVMCFDTHPLDCPRDEHLVIRSLPSSQMKTRDTPLVQCLQKLMLTAVLGGGGGGNDRG